MSEVTSRAEFVQMEAQSWFEDFKNGLRAEKMELGVSFNANAIPSWSLGAVVAKLQKTHADLTRRLITKRLEIVTNAIPLGDLCDVFLGLQHSRRESKPNGGILVVRGRDLSSESISKDDLNWFEMGGQAADKFKIMEGDVLLQRIGRNPRCAIVGADQEGAIASDTVFIIRPKDTRVKPTFIAQFLRSVVGQQLIQMGIRGRYAPTSSVSYLREIPIPLFSEHITRELDEVQQMEQTLKVRAEKIEGMRLNLFTAESREDLENRLREIRRVANVVATSMEHAETREFQIRNFYPFPLAFCYRSLSSYTLVQEVYSEQLNVAENILSFLGSLTLALISREDRTALQPCLHDTWRGGASLGNWRDVCQWGAKILETYQTQRLAKQMAALWRGKKLPGFAKAITDIVAARNEYHHGRGPKVETEFRAANANLGKLLDEVMAQVSFLTEYPIRLVRDFNVIRGTRRIVVQCLRYVGDHPGMQPEQVEYQEALTKNDLYLQLHEDYWLALYPLLTVQDCPRCRYRETYFIDRWDGPGKKAILKSFERGHTEENMDISTALANWQNGEMLYNESFGATRVN